MNRVFVTRRIPDAGLDALARAGAEVRIGQPDDEAPVPRQTLEAGIRWCDVLLPLLTERIDAELLAFNPALRGVANYAVGFDNIDVAAATALGIPVSNTPGVLTDTTADLTWALILAAARRIPEAHAYMTAGRYRLWGPNLMLGADVSPGGSGRRKVLGIVGFGRIGSAVARRALGFDMDVLAYDPQARERIECEPSVRWAELDDLLRASDFVTLHPLLTAETRHLIDARALGLMKRTAFLVNVSRGAVVDEAALVAALRTGGIAGAALDVYEHEPAMAPGLAECPNAVLVPHIASASVDTRDRMATMAAANAAAHLRGAPAPDVVNPAVYGTAAYRARIRRLA
ncbi:MAG TPA: D-glycerate dehydrogenase [Gemmatimonadaceae bacterium]